MSEGIAYHHGRRGRWLVLLCISSPNFFLLSPGSDRISSDGFKLKDGRLTFNIRNKLMALRLVRPWHKSPRQVMDVPSLEVLNRALNSLVKGKVSLLMAGGLELDGLYGLFQPNLVYDSVIYTTPGCVLGSHGSAGGEGLFWQAALEAICGE